ncbi:methionine ABC transporter ATP-binding protein [Bifidobacterium simiarum]|uniref:ABC transporter n=1 Tax=Bifidobacterium simiarum TaxID=2045441 RepID=A0A2M9HGF1_9BIFI|nr:ATP-binding cassette domain-containing protein [Bifidobacterium simiarum]PJM75892.1 ABC transporter [Bifidobacterium simiarum]
MSAIVYEHVGKSYPTGKGQSFQALSDVSLTVPDGEIFGVIGSSGAGKSTLLRMVNGLELPTEGHVNVLGQEPASLKGRELRLLRRQIGMIFQHYNLLSSKTIAENVAIPLVLSHTPKDEIARKVSQMLELVGLEDKHNVYPSQLSGGQRQRVGIARALVTNPKILLCDEATSALDPLTTVQILKLLQRINHEYGITIMLITHQMSVIAKACNYVAVVEHGRLIEQGPVGRVFAHPVQPLTRKFVNTVVPNTLNEDLRNRIDQGDEGTVVQFSYTDDGAKTLLADIRKAYDGNVSLLYANEVPLRNVTVGKIVLGFSGGSGGSSALSGRIGELVRNDPKLEAEVLHD